MYKKRKSLNRIDWKSSGYGNNKDEFSGDRKRAEIGLLVGQIPDEKIP